MNLNFFNFKFFKPLFDGYWFFVSGFRQLKVNDFIVGLLGPLAAPNRHPLATH